MAPYYIWLFWIAALCNAHQIIHSKKMNNNINDEIEFKTNNYSTIDAVVNGRSFDELYKKIDILIQENERFSKKIDILEKQMSKVESEQRLSGQL